MGQYPFQDRSDDREHEAQRQAGEDAGPLGHPRPGGEGMTMLKRKFLMGKGIRDHRVSPSVLLLDKDSVFKQTYSQFFSVHHVNLCSKSIWEEGKTHRHNRLIFKHHIWRLLRSTS